MGDEGLLEKKVEKKLTGDSSYDCNYCNGKIPFNKGFHVKKKEEKQEKVKDGAYYDMKIKDLKAKSKNLSLVEKNMNEDNGTYQIWSCGSDEEEIRHPMHCVMFARHLGVEKLVREGFESDCKEESADREENFEGHCFMETISQSSMNEKVRNLLIILRVLMVLSYLMLTMLVLT